MVTLGYRQSRVPFLHEHQIEEEALLLIAEWEQSQAVVVVPPVPIEEILECHLQLECEIVDLQADLGHPDALGGIWFGRRLIKVDQSLDPAINPSLLGRYRFTVAHEVGHWRLHRKHLANDPSAASLFDAHCEPAFVNRSLARPPEEIQANAFASHVLMPRRLLRKAWTQWRGNEDPVEVSSLTASSDTHEQEIAMDRFCKPLARQFEVSAEAMRYRLRSMKLVVTRIEPGLFQ